MRCTVGLGLGWMSGTGRVDDEESIAVMMAEERSGVVGWIVGTRLMWAGANWLWMGRKKEA